MCGGAKLVHGSGGIVLSRAGKGGDDVGFFHAFQDIFVGFFLLIVSIALIDLIRRFIGHRMAALEKKWLTGQQLPTVLGLEDFIIW